MTDKLKNIVKGILSEEFDVGDAFEFIKQKEGREVPREYTIHALRNGPIEKLNIPEDLGDDGELWDIYKFVHRPDLLTEKDLHIITDLNLSECGALKELPSKMYVGGTLNLFECRSLQKMPDQLYVGNYLNLAGCKSLTKLPANLKVGGSLSLARCKSLEDLPKGVFVEKTVYFEKRDPFLKRFEVDRVGDVKQYDVFKFLENELNWKFGNKAVRNVMIDDLYIDW